jgi:hypothetical protein
MERSFINEKCEFESEEPLYSSRKSSYKNALIFRNRLFQVLGTYLFYTASISTTFCLVHSLSERDPAERTFHESENRWWTWNTNISIMAAKPCFARLRGFIFHITVVQKNPLSSVNFNICTYYHDNEPCKGTQTDTDAWRKSTEEWESSLPECSALPSDRYVIAK